MSYLVTAFAAAALSLSGRRLWFTLVHVTRSLIRLAGQRQVLLLAVRVLAAGGDVDWRLRRDGLEVHLNTRSNRSCEPSTTT